MTTSRMQCNECTPMTTSLGKEGSTLFLAMDSSVSCTCPVSFGENIGQFDTPSETSIQMASLNYHYRITQCGTYQGTAVVLIMSHDNHCDSHDNHSIKSQHEHTYPVWAPRCMVWTPSRDTYGGSSCCTPCRYGPGGSTPT